MISRPWLMAAALAATTGCAHTTSLDAPHQSIDGKPVVYQMFTRLFGNTTTTNKPWGTIKENGVGKFADITDTALRELNALGATHIWYTGVPHHAVINDYTDYGISPDDPDVVKGRAGSPYAVKDYYNVNPDLADNPAQRLAEFEALIERTHDNGLKVIIDIVPNHVARDYDSISRPEGVDNLGARDDDSVTYARDNQFYYVVGERFRVPEPEGGYQPLGGDVHPLADGEFEENPAKWTGNGARAAQPDFNDWYETVKINYGVRPDGTYDFPRLPKDYAGRSIQAHHAYWQEQDLPDSWYKMRDIAHYWLDKGVDGFRYDMAEMVPVEFWSFLNASIKVEHPDAFLLAEIYNPDAYRDYIHLGKMDYLYAKVDIYDTLKPIMRGEAGTDTLPPVRDALADIDQHMLLFLENHDEQRIAHPEFAGDAQKGKPAMVVSALWGRGPAMIYFGQEVGEDADEDAGFGKASRTTIFDYWGVPAHQRWMNDGAFDGGQLSEEEAALREFYQRVLRLAREEPAAGGQIMDLHDYQRQNSNGYNEKLYTWARWSGSQRWLIVSHFGDQAAKEVTLNLPRELINEWQLSPGQYTLRDRLDSNQGVILTVDNDGRGYAELELSPLQSAVLEVSGMDASDKD
jgi:glycosidase